MNTPGAIMWPYLPDTRTPLFLSELGASVQSALSHLKRRFSEAYDGSANKDSPSMCPASLACLQQV